MFGTLRFFLALIVVMNHTPSHGFPLDFAVSAVILFYLITGHLMGLKFTEYRERCSRPGRLFLADRFLRIYPAYFIVLGATFGLIAFFGPSRSMAVEANAASLGGNLLLLPVNYFMFFPGLSLFIPQAFSLALEEQFYLLLPLLLPSARRISLVLMLGLLPVVGAAGESLLQHSLNKWTGDYLIYRLLPGAFPLFLLGVFVQREDRFAGRWRRVIFGAYAVLFVAAYGGDTLTQAQVLAVALGVLAGYPIVSYFARRPRHRLDEVVGRGAYGIFLVHFTVIWALQRFVFQNGVAHPLLFKLAILVLSVAGGYLIYYVVERPMHRLRHRYIAWFIARYPRVA